MPRAKCALCGKAINKSDPRVIANNRRYHADCYQTAKKHIKKGDK